MTILGYDKVSLVHRTGFAKTVCVPHEPVPPCLHFRRYHWASEQPDERPVRPSRTAVPYNIATGTAIRT
jgi:hypothetical protein